MVTQTDRTEEKFQMWSAADHESSAQDKRIMDVMTLSGWNLTCNLSARREWVNDWANVAGGHVFNS